MKSYKPIAYSFVTSPLCGFNITLDIVVFILMISNNTSRAQSGHTYAANMYREKMKKDKKMIRKYFRLRSRYFKIAQFFILYKFHSQRKSYFLWSVDRKYDYNHQISDPEKEWRSEKISDFIIERKIESFLFLMIKNCICAFSKLNGMFTVLCLSHLYTETGKRWKIGNRSDTKRLKNAADSTR